MRTPQLLCSSLLIVVASVACTRGESDANAQRTREQVKAVAARAGDQLADSWLTTKIQAQYFADDDIKARHINVSTRNGLVTLTGFVDTQPQRDLAVMIAKTTDGVRDVTDRLAVADPPQERDAVATAGGSATPAGSATTGGSAPAPASSGSVPVPAMPDVRQTLDDTQVTARVQSKFFVDDRVKARRIDVDTHQGVVTLSGEVASEDERAQALLLAREADGVQRVEDHLTVSTASSPASSASAPAPAAPVADDQTVTTTIQAKYFVDPTVKGSAVDVSSRNGVVTLSGTVPREAVRTQALAIARGTEGVTQVVDRLTVRRK